MKQDSNWNFPQIRCAKDEQEMKSEIHSLHYRKVAFESFFANNNKIFLECELSMKK